MDLDKKFPCIDDMERGALRRIPRFASEFLQAGIGRETGVRRNREMLDQVVFDPCYLPDMPANLPDLETTLFGKTYGLPFGVSPLGLSGLMWPGAVEILAKAARKANIPMGLSHFATSHMTDFRKLSGTNGWFQFYPARDRDVRHAMLSEISAAGFEELIVTVDIPTATRRDRELRVGLSVPPHISASTVWQVLTHPRWAVATLFEGVPKLKNIVPYIPKGLPMAEEAAFLTDIIEGHVTPDILRDVRDHWPGKLIVKGIMTAEDAKTALECGADGVWISNHGGRQLDAAKSPVEVLPAIRSAVGPDIPIMADSGVRNGLDIARMLALGADFVFLGRAFVFGVAAIDVRGGDHAVHVLREELRCAIAQIGCPKVHVLSNFLAD